MLSVSRCDQPRPCLRHRRPYVARMSSLRPQLGREDSRTSRMRLSRSPTRLAFINLHWCLRRCACLSALDVGTPPLSKFLSSLTPTTKRLCYFPPRRSSLLLALRLPTSPRFDSCAAFLFSLCFASQSQTALSSTASFGTRTRKEKPAHNGAC